MILNTNGLIEILNGKNKGFISRVAKQQEEKYGNVDIFQAELDFDYDTIEMLFGDYSITFYFRDGKVIDTLGNGQGHKYHKNLESCAIELHNELFFF